MTSETTYAFEQPGRFARGWHIILFSNELAIGEVRRCDYFNKEFVIFRNEDGEVGAVDAYCVHLGAHLGGRGAAVIGNNIRCPFHGWEYDQTGQCQHIPFASKIPERAVNALKSWPIVEKCGFIAVWHCPDGTAPTWDLPDIPTWGVDNWGDWSFRRSRLATQGKEIVENIVDKAHFAFVHGGIPERFDIEFDGIRVSQNSKVTTSPEQIRIIPQGLPEWLEERMINSPGGVSEGVATYHGPAVMYFYSEMDLFDVKFKTWWVNFHVPINEDEVELVSGVILAPLGNNELPDAYREMYPEIAHAAFGQDIEIWKDKTYRVDPILCDADGPINKLRKWYDQFYQSDIIAKNT